ncbi:heme-thiolate peroxidase [Neopestalotiopsis clavispora]|nr:heme-thiolate peroxidase [Neopestalotiopsis clavispora]
MHRTTPLTWFWALPTALALLTEADHPWQAPGPGDLRAPCPALNTLANHGFLPRDGRNVDLDTVGAAVLEVFNMDWETMLLVGEPALATSTTGNSSTFNLNDTVQHWPQEIEHDGSLSRNDTYFGDALSFSPEAWGRTLDSWGNIEVIDFQAAANELKERFDWGEAHNPEFNATFARTSSLLQYALVFGAFGESVQGDAHHDWVKFWFEHERLPFFLGWQPPTAQVNHTNNEAIAASIEALWDELE